MRTNKRVIQFLILMFATILIISVTSGSMSLGIAISLGLTYINGVIIGILWSRRDKNKVIRDLKL